MTSVMPGDMVPEVTGGTIVLDLADGGQVAIVIPKARWLLFAETARRTEVYDILTDELEEAFAEQWYGVKFRALDRLPGPSRAAFRLTHYYKPGGPRVRVEFPPEEAP